jgi:glycogen synthase
MVLLLREMLLLEAKDKEFLMSSISRVTDGREYQTVLRATLCISCAYWQLTWLTQSNS